VLRQCKSLTSAKLWPCASGQPSAKSKFWWFCANIIVQILDPSQVNIFDPKSQQTKQSYQTTPGTQMQQFRVKIKFLVVLRQHYSANP